MNWIRIKDRMPEESEAVLVYAEIGDERGYSREAEFFVAFYHNAKQGKKNYPKWRIMCTCSGRDVEEEGVHPIYWMQIPKLPKEDESKGIQ